MSPKKSATKTAKKRGIRSYKTDMRRFETLTGDVNWREYGAVWYRRTEPHIYYLIEFINFLDATNELYNGKYKYVVTGSVIDLSPGSAWHNQIQHALPVVGKTISGVRNELEILDAVNIYMGGDNIFTLYGNNADQLMREAKQRLS